MPPLIAAFAAIGTGAGTAIAGGAAAGATIYGAKSQASALRDAGRREERYSDQALEAAREQQTYDREQAARDRAFQEDDRSYRRQQYADFSGALEPYRASGLTASDRMAGLLTGSRQMPQRAGGATVQMRSPDGEVAAVPASLVEHYARRGARQV